MSVRERRSVELVAAARRDLEEVEAALRRRGRDDWNCLVTLAVLARAARAADDATFALLGEHALAGDRRPRNAASARTPEGHDEMERRTR